MKGIRKIWFQLLVRGYRQRSRPTSSSACLKGLIKGCNNAYKLLSLLRSNEQLAEAIILSLIPKPIITPDPS